MSYFLGLVLIFVIIPYHFVVAAENEIKRGRHLEVLGVLIGDEHAIPPRGAPYPKFWALALLLVLFLPLSLYLTTRLLDNLKPAAYMNLFTQLVYLRGLLYFGLGIESLVWYQRALNEIKRACVSKKLASRI